MMNLLLAIICLACGVALGFVLNSLLFFGDASEGSTTLVHPEELKVFCIHGLIKILARLFIELAVEPR